MSQTAENAPPPPPGLPLSGPTVVYLMGGLGVVAAAAAVYVGWQYRTDALSVLIYFIALALTLLGGAVVGLVQGAESEEERAAMGWGLGRALGRVAGGGLGGAAGALAGSVAGRYAGAAAAQSLPGPAGALPNREFWTFLALIVVGLVGLETALLGLALPLFEFRETFTGGFEKWREQPMRLFWAGLPLFGGLLLTLLALTLARPYERSHTGLRRLVHGYVAVLGSVLLLIVLILVNMLSYAPVWPFTAFAKSIDWTGQNTLQPETLKLLDELKEPVKVTIVTTRNNPLNTEIESVLEQCRARNTLVRYEPLSRDLNRTAVEELRKKFPDLKTDQLSLVLEVGREGDQKGLSLALEGVESAPPLSRFRTIETHFAKSIDFLLSNKKKAVVAFTTGNDEIPPRSRRGGESFGRLGQVLRASSEVRELPFDAAALQGKDPAQLLKDVDVVVVARPLRPLPEAAVNALRDFIQPHGPDKKRGRLVVLAEPPLDDSGKPVTTGLEALLAENKVRLTNQRLVSIPSSAEVTPLAVVAQTTAKGTNPVSDLYDNRAVPMLNAMPVEPVAGGPPGGPAAATLLEVRPDEQDFVVEDNLAANPENVASRLRRDTAERNKRKAQQPVPVAVAVSERPGESPYLLVIGNALWLTDEVLLVGITQAGQPQWNSTPTNVVGSSLAWMRGRSYVGARPDMNVARYEMDNVPAAQRSRLYWVPALTIGLLVVTLGLGVWVARRK